MTLGPLLAHTGRTLAYSWVRYVPKADIHNRYRFLGQS